MQIYLPVAELSLNVLLLAGIGLAIGFLSGMFGVGGGFIMTPLLIFLGVPAAVAVGTGASQIVAASVSSAVGHWRRGNIDMLMGYFLIGGGVFGAITGVKIVYALKQLGQLDLFVSLTYVILLGVIGALMLIESVRTLRAGPTRPGGSARRAGQHTWIQRLPLKQRSRPSSCAPGLRCWSWPWPCAWRSASWCTRPISTVSRPRQRSSWRPMPHARAVMRAFIQWAVVATPPKL